MKNRIFRGFFAKQTKSMRFEIKFCSMWKSLDCAHAINFTFHKCQFASRNQIFNVVSRSVWVKERGSKHNERVIVFSLITESIDSRPKIDFQLDRNAVAKELVNLRFVEIDSRDKQKLISVEGIFGEIKGKLKNENQLIVWPSIEKTAERQSE